MLRLLNIGVWLASLGLLFLGLHTLVVPELAAQGYGLGLSGDAPGWMLAAGARDFALGVILLGLRKHLALLWPALLATAIVPLADASIVWGEAGGPLAAAPHLVGLVGLLALAGMAWHLRGHRDVDQPEPRAG